MTEFQAFPKIPRLNRDVVITEKIDGTNAAVIIELWHGQEDVGPDVATAGLCAAVKLGTQWFTVGAQSRKRLITPGKNNDNAGFAGWVEENAVELVQLMGPGRHFGEWWGKGIQRGYGLDHKKFSLFNPTFRFNQSVEDSPLRKAGLVDTVPVLYEGAFSSIHVNGVVSLLAATGSKAAPGFMDPEGVIVFHTAAGTLFKVTVKDDEKPKGSTEL
jgi:hypothetical protein